MKLKRIAAAMLAAVLMTSTAVYAEDATTEQTYPINFTVNNDKGTYTFTDDQYAALLDYETEINGADEDTAFHNKPSYIFDENSTFTISNNDTFSLDQVWQVTVEYIDVSVDTEGNISMKKLLNAYSDYCVTSQKIWVPKYAGDAQADEGFGDTITASRIMQHFRLHPISQETLYNAGYDDIFDAVDLVKIYFHYSEEEISFDDNGKLIPPEVSGWVSEGLFTENGAALLKEASNTTDTETDETPETDESTETDEAPATSGYVNDLIAAIPEDTAVTMKTAVAEGVYSQRFVQKVSVDALECASKAEFTLSNGTDTVKRSTDKCYSSLYVNGSIQQAGEGYVFLCFTVKDIPEDMQLTVESIEII